MSTAWVAGTVRAKALARRRLGAAGARALAGSPTLGEALTVLAASPYGHDVRADQTLAEAQHAVGATLLWHMRVLAGWVPRHGADVVRLLAAGFEVANVDEHVHRLGAGLDDSVEHGVEGGVGPGPGRHPSGTAFHLGALATAWGRLGTTRSFADLRRVLRTSAWGDPGGESAWAVHVGMRLAWAVRVERGVPSARPWAAGGAALLVARQMFLMGHELPTATVDLAAPVLGRRFDGAGSLADLAGRLPVDARWALDEVADPADLWQAEAAWWQRVQRDGLDLLRGSRFGPGPVVGALAVLGADARRVGAALEVAARAGAPLEAFDGVA
ncbi:MAG: hypothetical protein ACRDYU_00325 [Actinomycetes bacterium]